jgi:hypothetical protein
MDGRQQDADDIVDHKIQFYEYYLTLRHIFQAMFNTVVHSDLK